MAHLVAHLFDERITQFEGYLCEISEKLYLSTSRYWKRFGRTEDAVLGGSGLDCAHELRGSSLCVSPGRRKCRNGITFEKFDKKECTKIFYQGNAAVPSLLTMQCACAHPKLIGFVVLTQFETISAALPCLLTHCKIPARNVWYDNECNSFESAMLRISWLLQWSRFVVDRFHYTGHNCCNIYNGELQKDLDQDRSVAAEVINSLINKGASDISYNRIYRR